MWAVSLATANAAGADQIISPTTAYMITNMLAAVVDHGNRSRPRANAMKGTAFAGKTGTSRDGWFIGYTPNLVASCGLALTTIVSWE